jgi:hypothetical protein
MTVTARHAMWLGNLLVFILLGIALFGTVTHLATPARWSGRLDTRTSPTEARDVPTSAPASWIDPVWDALDPLGRPDLAISAQSLARRLAEQRAPGGTVPGQLHCGAGGWCVDSDGRVIEVVDR